MGFNRALLRDATGMTREMRAGDGVCSNAVRNTITADSNQTIPVAAMLGGLILRSGATATRTDTTDTAANIVAAVPNMDIGDNFEVTISNQSAQSIVLAGGTGVTASGNLTIVANTPKLVVFFRTGAATFDMVAL